MAHDGDETPKPPSRERVDALLRAQDWNDISAKLTAFAYRRTGSRDRAKEAAQEAILRVLDARWTPWDPEKNPSLIRFLMSIVNRNLANEKVVERRHRELVMDDEADDDDDARDGAARLRQAKQAEQHVLRAPSPEATTVNRDLYARRTRELRALLAHDEGGLQVLDLMEEGVETAADQRVASGRELPEIRTARRRMFHNARKVVLAERRASGELAAGEMDDDGTEDDEERR